MDAKIFFRHNNGTSVSWFSCNLLCACVWNRVRKGIWMILFCTSTGSKAPGSSHHGFHLHRQMLSTTTCLAHTFTSITLDQYSWFENFQWTGLLAIREAEVNRLKGYSPPVWHGPWIWCTCQTIRSRSLWQLWEQSGKLGREIRGLPFL